MTMLKGKTTSSSCDPYARLARERSKDNRDNHGTFLRFITADGHEFGFPFSQLLQFIPEPQSDPDTPQQLHLMFSSHDVTVTGCRLDLLCEQLDPYNAIRLRAEDPRFASLHPDEPFVAEISISSVRLGSERLLC